MKLLYHEFHAVASMPILWLGALLLCALSLQAVAHLRIDEDKIGIGFYRTQVDPPDTQGYFTEVQELAKEIANVEVKDQKKLDTDLVSQMIIDKNDIAVTRSQDGWRFTIKSRSVSEHNRLVRVAQALGASFSQRKPWFLIAYEELGRSTRSIEDWPGAIHIAGVTADPGRHARVFIPKTIALLAYFMAFAFACRSMIRDIANNTISTLLVAANGRWVVLALAKILVAVLFGMLTLWLLLIISNQFYSFEFKNGLMSAIGVQMISLVASATLGLAASLFARTETRIYFIASGYLVLLVLLSGLIAKIDPSETVLVAISSVLPLGYAMDSLSDWMFFGSSTSLSDQAFQALLFLMIASGLLACCSVLYYRRYL